MKFRYLPLLALAFVFGCSKPATSGDVASKSTDSTTGSTTATTGATPEATTTTGTPPSSTTGTPPPAPPSATTTGSKPNADAPPPMTPPPPATAAGAPPAAQPSTPTPDQQKAMQKQMADQMAAQKNMAQENAAKAEKASKIVLDGVKGTYQSVVDESKIPAQTKARPDYATQVAKLKAVSLVVANDGSVTLKGLDQGPVKEISGMTSKIDGKPVIVFTNPKPQPGGPTKQFAPLKITDGGGTVQFGFFTFKRS